MENKDFDIAIIGAGPAGLSFACLMADSGLKLALLEKLPTQVLEDPPQDGRDIALTHLSYKILNRLGIWQRFGNENISPIKQAKVLDGESSYTLDFDTGSSKDEALGFIVANHHIRRAVYEQARQHDHITWMTETEVVDLSTDENGGELTLADGTTLSAGLIISADTRFSETRRKMGIGADMHDFGRVAIVCEMTHEKAHQNVAYECFHYGRTLAILPMPGDMSSIVITVPANLAPQIMAMDEAAFAHDVERRFNARLGAMKLIGKRHPYPLVAVHANQFVKQRYALLGDAAVGMHPVTAHGYNLGLSGADVLSTEMKSAMHHGKSFASDDVLKRYQNRHRQVTLPLYHGTNQVVGLFTNDSFPASMMRKAVLRLSNNLPPVKWAIKNKLMSKGHMPTIGLPSLPSFLS